MKAFREAFHALKQRIDLFLSLPIENLDRQALRNRVQEIGRDSGRAS